MTDFERIMSTYDAALRQATEELVAQVGIDPDDRDHLFLLDELLRSLVRGYGSHHLRRAGDLHTTTSVMYAAEEGSDRILDVPMRSLVDADSLSQWQARLLGGLLNEKRTLVVTGAPQSGKSTLLNSIIQLVAVDERIVAVEGEPGLPVLRHRSFTVRLSASADASSAPLLTKAAGMRPTWLVADPLAEGDLLAFLDAGRQGPAGLATLDSLDPEADLPRWTELHPPLTERLRSARPYFLHMERDDAGRPRLARMWETVADEQAVSLEERRQT